MQSMGLLSVVAILEDKPQRGLIRGQVGTIVASLEPGMYEVEFSDDDGHTYASLALHAEELMALHHHPAAQVA